MLGHFLSGKRGGKFSMKGFNNGIHNDLPVKGERILQESWWGKKGKFRVGWGKKSILFILYAFVFLTPYKRFLLNNKHAFTPFLFFIFIFFCHRVKYICYRSCFS